MPETKQCPFPAAYRYRWAGVGEYDFICSPHAQGLAKLCKHMGWQQYFERLAAGVIKQCSQQIAEDDPIFANSAEPSAVSNSPEQGF